MGAVQAAAAEHMPLDTPHQNSETAAKNQKIKQVTGPAIYAGPTEQKGELLCQEAIEQGQMEWEVKADVEQDSALAPLRPDAPLPVGVAADVELAWGAEGEDVALDGVSSKGWDAAWSVEWDRGNEWIMPQTKRPLLAKT